MPSRTPVLRGAHHPLRFVGVLPALEHASLMEDLEGLADAEDKHVSTIARALLYIIEKLQGKA